MEETKADEKVACSMKCKCCCGKAFIALGLIALGAVGGYFGGRCCAAKDAARAAATAPATPAK